jgi:hypothetical protein
MVVGSLIASCMLVNAQQRAHGGGGSDGAIVSQATGKEQDQEGRAWSRSGRAHSCSRLLTTYGGGETTGLVEAKHEGVSQQYNARPPYPRCLFSALANCKLAASRTMACMHVSLPAHARGARIMARLALAIWSSYMRWRTEMHATDDKITDRGATMRSPVSRIPAGLRDVRAPRG